MESVLAVVVAIALPKELIKFKFIYSNSKSSNVTNNNFINIGILAGWTELSPSEKLIAEI